MNEGELRNWLDPPRNGVPVRVIDEDGFIREIVGVMYDPDDQVTWIRTEIKTMEEDE